MDDNKNLAPCGCEIYECCSQCNPDAYYAECERRELAAAEQAAREEIDL